MAFEIKVKKVRENAVVPKIATSGSAAADLYACIEEPLVVSARGSSVVPVGIAIAVPEGYGAFIFARSGLGIKHGIAPRNCVGVIDSDYRGEICVGLINKGQEDFKVERGDRIAQLMFMPVCHANLLAAETLDETERGEGGFGSTGIK
jgi:dUTP pyrophosphatase